MMNGHEIIRNKNRRKTEQKKTPKIDLDFSKIKASNLKLSITPRRKIKINNYKNKPNKPNNLIYNHKSQKLLNSIFQKDINIQTSGLIKSTYFIPSRTKTNNNSFDSKRFSQESLQAKAKQFLQKYNLKNGENAMNIKNVGNYTNSSNKKLNQLEYNIQNKINNMRIQIEKQAKIMDKNNTIDIVQKKN